MMLHLLLIALVPSSNALRLLEAKQKGSQLQVRGSGLPQNGHVAIILRGQAFRSQHLEEKSTARETCQESGKKDQLDAADSLLTNIVDPLERNGNTVDFFVVNGDKDCPLFQSLLSKYGNRVKASKEFESPNQPYNIREALNQFKHEAGGLDNIASQYDLVMITRHDQHWEMPIDKWPTAKFNKFNFFSLCETKVRVGGGPKEKCVNDVFHMMPGSMFAAFDGIVQTPRCWQVGWKAGSGHGCYSAMASKIGDDQITLVTNWRPQEKVRETNPVGNLVGGLTRDAWPNKQKEKDALDQKAE